jgi:membrane protein
MIFGVSKSFGLEEKLDQVLTQYLSGQKEMLDNIIAFSHNLLENTKGGLVAGIGVLVLIWSVIKVMNNIEISFNAIWGIKKGRTWVKKFTEYLAFVILAPIFLIVSTGFSVVLANYVFEVINFLGLSHAFAGVFKMIFQFFPYFIMWILFALLFLIMPNTSVSWKAAFSAAIIAGSAFQLLEWMYVKFQIGVVQYNAVYGSFAIFPLFLVWLQSSWMILLLGGELSFAYQNHANYEYEGEVNEASLIYKRKVSLMVTHYVIKHFVEGKTAPDINQISKDLKIPYRLASYVLSDLVEANVITKVSSDKYKEVLYQPAQDTNRLSIAYVFELLERTGKDELPDPDSPVFHEISTTVEQFFAEIKKMPQNKLIKEI